MHLYVHLWTYNMFDLQWVARVTLSVRMSWSVTKPSALIPASFRTLAPTTLGAMGANTEQTASVHPALKEIPLSNAHKLAARHTQSVSPPKSAWTGIVSTLVTTKIRVPPMPFALHTIMQLGAHAHLSFHSETLIPTADPRKHLGSLNLSVCKYKCPQAFALDSMVR